MNENASDRQNKEDISYRRQRKGCSLFTCGGCLQILFITLIASLILLIITIIYRPPLLWEPFKSILNISIDTPEKQERIDNAGLFEVIQLQVSNDSEIELSEQELYSLLTGKSSKDIRLDIQGDLLYLYIDLDDIEETTPLWLCLVMTSGENGTIQVVQSGFGLVKLPGFVNELITQGIGTVLGTSETGSSIIDWFVGTNRSVNITKVRFENEKVYLDLTINNKLLDILPSF